MTRFFFISVFLFACGSTDPAQSMDRPAAPLANAAVPPAPSHAAVAPRPSIPSDASAPQSLKARALANGGCYGGATYGVQNSGLTVAELAALDDELALEPGANEMSGGYGYSAPRAAQVFPLCKVRTSSRP